jgi:hypothetical protein
MSYVTIICPNCEKELFMPEDARGVVCMYCTKPLDLEKLIKEEKEKKNSKFNRDEMLEILSSAKMQLPEKIVGSTHEKGNKFTASYYLESFPKYAKSLYNSLNLVNKAYKYNKNSPYIFAETLFDLVKIQAFSNKEVKENGNVMLEARYFLVTYFIPAILEYDSYSSEILANEFIKLWNNNFENSKISKTTYEEIANGFRYKSKFCFITTATCKALGKSENCNELEIFRSFRDNWSTKSDQNMKDVEMYYIKSPLYVYAIDNSKDKNIIYSKIWNEFLDPCFKLIESFKYEDCAIIYKDLMRYLDNKFYS